MKKRQKRRLVTKPQLFLVGNSGEVKQDHRLCRLHMAKKSKKITVEQENEICRKEFERFETTCQERSLPFETEAGDLDSIPEPTNETKGRSKRSTITASNAHSVTRKSLVHNVNRSYQKIIPDITSENKSNESNEASLLTTSWTGSYKSQIFVRKSNSELEAINIDLFSLGSNLYHVLAQEFGDDVTKCTFMFGAKEVDREKTLFEQEIYHGSTIELSSPLYGGMDRKKKRNQRAKKNKEKIEKTNKEQSSDNSQESLQEQIVQWFEKATELLGIDASEVSDLKSLNSNELNVLKEEDWEKHSPDCGRILFGMWRNYQKSTKEKVESKDHTDIVEPDSIMPLERKKEVQCDTDDTNISKQIEGPGYRENDNSNSPRKQLLGEVDALEEIGESSPLEDFESDGKSPAPILGDIIAITGVCSSDPQLGENFGTLYIRSDPKGAARFYNTLKIVISLNPLRPNAINILKKIFEGMHVGVKGRVEKMDKGDDFVNKIGCEMLNFKLIIESDDHALIYLKAKPPKITRQLSQSWWWPQQFDPESVNELDLNVGDFIVDNDLKRVYCDANAEDELILQYVIAFKNTFDGEIFVGAKENGEIVGIEKNSGEMKKWCEELCKTIGNILPESNDGADICRNIRDAIDLFHRKRCFVYLLPLGKKSSRTLCWIHVPKGEAKVYFSKGSDVHAFKRIGAENRRINNYEHLFNELDSLASRPIEQIPEEDCANEEDEQNEENRKMEDKYKILNKVDYENQHNELKMIFGENPAKIIRDRYLANYVCGFLNADGGSILFGVQEDEDSKEGYIVGVVLSKEERKELVQTTAQILANFYPPVGRSQYRIEFHPVNVPLELIVKNVEKSGLGDQTSSKLYSVIAGPSEEIGKKWPNFTKKASPGIHSALIPIRSQRFCIVSAKKGRPIPENLAKQFVEEYSKSVKKNSKSVKKNSKSVKESSEFRLQTINEEELKNILNTICVVEVKVNRSPYPIHMIKPIDTYMFKKENDRQLCKVNLDDLMGRFKFDSDEFNLQTFLEHVKNFDSAGNSYILVTSPFELPEDERDLYGLVIPKWTLTIDFDQQPKESGHLFDLFQKLNDRYHTERDRFLKSPEDSKLDLNPDHAICWLAVRGYREDKKTLSEDSHAKWNKTHRSSVRDLLNEGLKTNVKPNCLNVVVLWNEGNQTVVESLRTILEDVISLDGDDSTVITFVCATPKARSDITSKIIQPLQEDNWETISEDRVYVAPPHALARFLSLALPSPYRPEDDYQVPFKKHFRSGGNQTIPQVLPQRLRQNLSGYVDMMYIKKERKLDETLLNKERKNFFSGSEISNDGLRGNIAIRRTRMDDLEKKFKALINDKKSHVSLIFVKVDRGAGSTTMCKQFLYGQHKTYPCAQLIEIRDGLVSHIEEINKKTKLPLILLVDENIAHLQDFLDFKRKVERRNVNVIFILIEPAELISTRATSEEEAVFSNKSLPKRKQIKSPQKVRTKSARDSYLYGPSPYKVVELRRRLDAKEMEELVKVLTVLAKGKKKQLLKLKENNFLNNEKTQTFAHFSLTAFGNEFTGLKQYVKFRLGLANEQQKHILAFLSLTHVFTDYFVPASALVHFLKKPIVKLDDVMENKYLQELLSPRTDGTDSRRTSFLEVAQEILKQLSATSTNAQNGDDAYWIFVKSISVAMATNVLSKCITNKKIDRLTRKLFVTSEYESEKFSLLIRSMRAKYPDTARDTLNDLVRVFDKKDQSSIRAHLRAHLAKYLMTEYQNFKDAKKLIEDAIDEQKDDPLLHHIHGDIIRQYVLHLTDKVKGKEEMEIIVSHAYESSGCFESVRAKKPHMSHGYVSDAMLRITVMKAGIEVIGGGKNNSFVDYLIQRVDEIKERGDEEISPNSRYLLSLIPDAHQHLDERVIDFEQKEKWKENFLDCIGELENLQRLCAKIKQEESFKPFVGSTAWLNGVVVETQILYHALEMENKVLSPQEIETKLIKMEEYNSHSGHGDRFMKYWMRYSRRRLTVPHLREVKKKVDEWFTKMKKKRIRSPQAEFYNFVVLVLFALKYPTDRDRMDKAEEAIKRRQLKRLSRKEDFALPLEWLHPKDGHHIESIDCLLHHDDLIEGTNISSKSDKRKPIEASLFEKGITQWEGTITAIRSEWQGTITLKELLSVRFVPLNAQPSMPSKGDTVKFCLSFDNFGLSAWRVMRDVLHPSDFSEMVNRNDSSSENSEPEDNSDDQNLVSPSLCSMDVEETEGKRNNCKEHEEKQLRCEALSKKGGKWDAYGDQIMQGLVDSINSEDGFGFIINPHIDDKLFFHAAQLRVPVKELEGNISVQMLLEFKVEKLTKRTRAADIRVLKDENLRQSMIDAMKRKKKSSSLISNDSRCQEGVVENFFPDNGYGFITPNNDRTGRNIYFSRRNLLKRGISPKCGDRVQFCVRTKDDRSEATDILVQNKSILRNRWAGFIGAGIQEGIVCSTTDDGGTISNSKLVTGTKSNLHFRNKDINGNKSKRVVEGTTVHFEVKKRGGKCIAFNICIIDSPDGPDDMF
ncbi:uncharacterized protein LOC114530234 isoform X3 [Dendronephthya gigantea]|uniref:uncharacterized protein LOC114530234 isoform X3 n=1 Tax=Dendronephthya gigantea TaxID=151771 RepID=UPI00106B062F|nr:uncharacterized protein LOC114530234 isoform X3 [Dendronephthya gigantea]